MYTIRNNGEDSSVSSLDEIHQLHAEGKISKDTPIYDHTKTVWTTLKEMRQVLPEPTLPASSVSLNSLVDSNPKITPKSKLPLLHFIATAIILVLLGISLWGLLQIQSSQALSTKALQRIEALHLWEYKVTFVVASNKERTGKEAFAYSGVIPSDDSLNQLGKEGWELVSTYLEMETAWPNFGKDEFVTGIQPNIRPQRLVLVFKRQLRE